MRERERERERESQRERESACVHVCVLYYNTKQFYMSDLTWEQGWLGSLCASSQYDQTLSFLHIIRDGCTYLRHTLDYRKYIKYPATSCGIKHKKLYLKLVFKSTT